MSPNNQLQKRFEHPFQKIFGTFWEDQLPAFENKIVNSPISLAEDDKAVYVEASVPGLNASEIDVTLENKVLWIRGSKKEGQDNKKYHYRSKKTYSYQISLPETVDENKEPETKYEHGVLSITFSKIKGESAKKIQIK
jgi:HSP20 family protein